MANEQHALDQYNDYRTDHKLPPLAPKARWRKARGLQMTDSGWEGLRDLSMSLGYDSITALLEAIGHGLWALQPKGSKTQSGMPSDAR